MHRLVVFALLAVACDPFGKERAAQAERIADLEKKLAGLVEATTKTQFDDLAAQRRMDVCFADANDAYWRIIELNGRKKRGTENQPGGPVWTARNDTWELAATKKRLALEECRIRFAKN